MPTPIVAGNLISAVTYGGFTTETTAAPVDPTDSLLSSPADILQAYIVDVLGLLSDPADNDDWPCYVGFLPEDYPSRNLVNAVAVLDTNGVKDAKTMLGSMIVKHGIQIAIRSSTYQAGWVKAETIAIALDAIAGGEVTNDVDTYEIQNASRTGPVLALGVDEKRASRFVINLRLTVKKQ